MLDEAARAQRDRALIDEALSGPAQGGLAV
jgi:hypothetical protein